ncbi:hypothetical protein EC917_11217 [Bacillus thuringiensis]|uniref:Uncharacterized protein n=1 Tax=Bacillus thuringiensis TaxID=1428 RepID=A0A4R4BBK5_BACTU|nr:hypothetical protein EC917_11217 [Bacillus thuringiensis]TCW53068.1 hypothetical protein EC910_11217 [Bacillus thuringiensis]
MEWLALTMGIISFLLVYQEMEKNKKLEKRIQELEDKVQ